MNGDWWALVVLVAAPLTLRIIDILLPKGRHLALLDRWLVKDDPEDAEDEA